MDFSGKCVQKINFLYLEKERTTWNTKQLVLLKKVFSEQKVLCTQANFKA